MFEKVMNLIQSRTRDDWMSVVKDRWVALRIWIQENGEYMRHYISFYMCTTCHPYDDSESNRGWNSQSFRGFFFLEEGIFFRKKLQVGFVISSCFVF